MEQFKEITIDKSQLMNTQVDIVNFDISKLNKKNHNFITETSKDIDSDLIKYAEQVIDRGQYVILLSKLLNDIKMSIDIEESIFEFALIHTTINNLLYKFISPVYKDKYNEIFLNIDENSYLKNNTLKEKLISGKLKTKTIAFMSPDQLHPEKCAFILKKRQYRLDKEQNMATTDIYKCYKCGERKCKISQLQTRSADEPITTFVTCTICYNTFTQ
jgi:DNA-directed RNA polymerase subunit M/transcription elongation factor TFIIS